MGRREIPSLQDPQQQPSLVPIHIPDSISSGEDSESDSDSSPSSPCASNSSPMDDPPFKLPVKKGLSKYYAGKSQSFTSLASVRSLEDLPKKENPYNMRMQMCKTDAHPHRYIYMMKRLRSPNQSISNLN